ncbi:MAG: OmpA family protein [Patescibacteria group bacterium]|nr:OmpA family protein [Patescibacteria group bacterium]
MKRFSLVMFILLAIVANIAADERLISGYGTDEFAVKGEIEVQVKILVAEIKDAQPGSTNLVITIIGSADNRGISAQNDQLSKNRAEAVEGVLASEFPGAKINVVPKGDGENSRQVVVEYKFIKITPDKNFAEIKSKLDSLSASASKKTLVDSADKAEAEAAGRSFRRVLVVIVSLLIISLVAVILLKKLRRKPTASEETSWNVKVEELEIKTTSKGNFRVKVLRKWRTIGNKTEEVFISPFTNTGDEKENIKMSHKRDIVNSLKRCLEGDKFASQVTLLLDQKKVTKIV